MSITELWTSREMHITKDGTTITRYFTCTYDDWNAGTDGTTILPVIGDTWNDVRPDLRVTDVRLYWIDNLNCRIECLYSTKGMGFREGETDKVASVRDSFDFSVQAISGMKFHDTDTNAQEWPALYGSEDAPDLIWYRPNITYTQKMYLSNWNFTTVKNAIGKVNNSDFISQYYVDVEGDSVDITGDDTGKWLFAGFNASQIRQGVYEILMTFLYNDEGWNTPHGASNIKMYGTANFSSLPFPTDTATEIDDGLR